MADITIYERDVWIVNYIQNIPTGEASVRDIWEAARAPRVAETEDMVRGSGGLAETASLPTYHRTVAKLVARGYLERAGGSGEFDAVGTEGAKYKVAAQVSSLTALSQPDLNDILLQFGPTEALARYVDEVERYEGSAQEVLRTAAERLLHEDPRELVLRMLRDRARELDEDLADLRDEETSEVQHRGRVERTLNEFGRFVHGQLGLNPSVWYIPTLDELESHPLYQGGVITPSDWDPIRNEVAQHIFGKSFLEYVVVPDEDDDPNTPPLHVAGTDASTHPGQVRGMPAAAYVDDERLMLTFNNSAGYIDLTAAAAAQYPSQFHGVPVTRAALEDPSNKGMILSPPWYQDLADGEYEHLKKVSLDVVQFRIDEQLLSGEALPYGTHPVLGGPALPAPNVLIRDGTVSPQARELQNYERQNVYGEFVREGIRRSYKILRMVMDSERRVYAGAVKSTQLQTFSEIVGWYIRRGSSGADGRPIDPAWQKGTPSVSDSYAMTRLIGALPPLSRRNQMYRTCVIVRPFPAMVTGLFRRKEIPHPENWVDYFQTHASREARRRLEHPGETPWFVGKDIAEDAYVRMCRYADYGMFYFGRPGGSPQLIFPRFEFLDSIRTLSSNERRGARVEGAATLIMRGVRHTKWSLDQDHSMFTGSRLPKLVPFVVYEAHEKSKVLGHKLVSELQQVIASKLSSLKELRLATVPKIEVEPVPLKQARQYLKRMARNIPKGEPVGDAVPNDTQSPNTEHEDST